MDDSDGIVFVTGNQNKLRELNSILGGKVQLRSQSIDLPEIQGSIEDVARDKCSRAAQEIQGPVLTEDTALCFDALQGLPGAYIKWFMHAVGHDGLNRMLAGFPEKGATAVCTFAFCKGPGEPVLLFEGKTHGTIVPARGPANFGWDPIFQPDGLDQTYAQMDKDAKNKISHRFKALDKFWEWLKAQ